MASVYQKRCTWYVGFKDATGAQRYQSTKATTKTEARRLAVELERRAERQRLGLEPLPDDCTMTLWELCDWWLRERCPERSRADERLRMERHVKRTPLGDVVLSHVTPAVIDERLHAMTRDGAAAASVNKLRSILHAVFARARKAALWHGVNPIADVDRRKVPRRAYDTLSAEEVPLMLANVPDAWRPMFAAAVYTGMRKGELAGLRKIDVDLHHGTITVARSYDHDTTKGGRVATVPVAPPLMPVLRNAMAAPGDLMFPDADGNMRKDESDPQKILRHALARAGLVNGYDHTCRRCKARGTPHVERHEDATQRRCPACGMRLWPRAVHRAIRFHDLRHTTATLLLRLGVDAHRVQRLLRHRDVTTTTGTYGHLIVDDLRGAMEALGRALPSMEAAPEPLSLPGTFAFAAGPFTNRLLPDSWTPQDERPGPPASRGAPGLS
jgi:integrase